MKFFNGSFLKNMFSSACKRDLMLGDLLQSLKDEGPSRNTREKIILLGQKYSNDQGIVQCLSHAISYVDAFYGKKAAYAITQDLCKDTRSYNRVRDMAEKRAPALFYGMTFEPIVSSYKNDALLASHKAVSICEQFMNGPVKDSLVNHENEQIKPVNMRQFYYSLNY